jgi:predicted acylesterase/phospholipase RssA
MSNDIKMSNDINLSSILPTTWVPRVLILGPGGIKGFEMLGFLTPLEDAGILKHIDTFCGVSIGSIIALLYITGYTIREIVFEATKLNIFSDLYNLDIKTSLFNKGVVSNDKIKNRLSNLIYDKLGSIPSLFDLYKLTGKSFVSVSLNTTDQESIIMDPFTHPNVPCIDACMYSINIPFVFYQLYYNNKLMIDGAFANPYPINYFDDGNTNILGLYVSSKKSINLNIVNNIEDEEFNEISVLDYIDKIINYLMELIKNNYIDNSSSKCKNVQIFTLLNNTFKYDINIEEKAKMLVNGYNEGRFFIKNLDSDIYTKKTINKMYKYP